MALKLCLKKEYDRKAFSIFFIFVHFFFFAKKLDEEFVEHVNCSVCNMYGWYYISALEGGGDCNVTSVQV
jgi:hypothetical protein